MQTSESYTTLFAGEAIADGAVARPGYGLARVSLRQPLPVEAGFAAIGAHLTGLGRPLTALCGVELRSPKPFTSDGFAEFNAGYVRVITRLGLVHAGRSRLARTNVVPVLTPPPVVSIGAFTYTLPANTPQPDFISAGYGDIDDDGRIVAAGATDDQGLARKATFILNALGKVLAGLAVTLDDVTAANVYSPHSLGAHAFFKTLPHAAALGLTWIYSRPPLEGLDLELDVRRVRQESVM